MTIFGLLALRRASNVVIHSQSGVWVSVIKATFHRGLSSPEFASTTEQALKVHIIKIVVLVISSGLYLKAGSSLI